MPDQPVTDHGPVFPVHQFLKIDFNLFRGGRLGKTQPVGKALHVGVDHDSLIDAECVSEYDVGGFSADSSQLDEGGHGWGNFAVVLFDQSLTALADISGLAPEKPNATDV